MQISAFLQVAPEWLITGHLTWQGNVNSMPSMIYKRINDCYNDPTENIFPKGTDAQTCLEILVKHFLGYAPIISYPGHITQWNSEVTTCILEKLEFILLTKIIGITIHHQYIIRCS